MFRDEQRVRPHPSLKPPVLSRGPGLGEAKGEEDCRCPALNLQPIRDKRKRIQLLTCSMMDGIAYSRSDAQDGRLPCSERRNVFTVQHDSLQQGHIAETRHAVSRKARIQNFSILEVNPLKQRPSHTLDDRALDLVFEMFGVDDRATFEGSDRA